MKVRIKVSGVSSPEDARACVDAGVDAIGVCLSQGDAHGVTASTAREIVQAVSSSKVLVVAMVADLDTDAARALRDDLGFGCLELTGDESPATLAPLLPHAYKAARVGSAADVERARAFPGDYVLVRAPGVEDRRAFDWTTLVPLSRARRLTIAGGLTLENVGDVVRAVRPYCVDVSYGAEIQDAQALRAFVTAVRALDV